MQSGDIVLSTDNPLFIKGAHKDHNIITYSKGSYGTDKITIANITKAMLRGFGTAVGSFSNTATCMYAMAAMFEKPEQRNMHDELMLRIKLLREIVGNEIDKIKGAAPPSLPAEWKKFERIEPEDDDATKSAKYQHNAMVISKKPYFFRYLYPELNQQFKRYEDSYNKVSKNMFGIKFKKLMLKKDKTPAEINLIRKYQKYSPLITSNCIINILCREIESIDFDIQFAKDENDNKRPTISMLPTFESEFASTFSDEKLKAVKKMYTIYSDKRASRVLEKILEKGSSFMQPDKEFSRDEIIVPYIDAVIDALQLLMDAHNISAKEFLFYCSHIAKTKKNFNWGFAWETLGSEIIDLIPLGNSYAPVEDEQGEEYLGRKYILHKLTPEQAEQINEATTIVELQEQIENLQKEEENTNE